MRPAVDPVTMMEPPSAMCGSATATVFITPRRSTSVGVDEVGSLRISQGHGEDAGVGDDDVEPSEIGNACLDRVAQLGPLAHVGLAGHDAAAKLLDRSLGLCQVLGVESG